MRLTTNDTLLVHLLPDMLAAFRRAYPEITIDVVIWFLLTCRPDLLPIDLKRQGRAEEHIALFYPHTDEERLAMLRAMQKKCTIQLAPDVEQYFVDHSGGLSGADIEAVLARTRMAGAGLKR